MLGRRLLLLVALLLAVGAIAAALTPRELRGPANTTPTTRTTATTPAPVEATGGVGASAQEVTRTVDSEGPEPAVVRARVGDLLHLSVAVPAPEVVELVGLGRFESADASTPARFDFFLEGRGDFPIRLQESGRQVGRLLVSGSPP